MKKILILLVTLTVAVGAFAQRINRLNIDYSNSYNANFNTNLGNGDLGVVSLELLPSLHESGGLFGTIGKDSKPLSIGFYGSMTVNSWEDKRTKTDTAFGIADVNAQALGIMALFNLPEMSIGKFIVIAKTGPSFLQKNSHSKMLYNFYTDSVFTSSALKNFTEKLNAFNWDISLKTFRFDRHAAWAFRNSLEINYSAAITATDKIYSNGVFSDSRKTSTGLFSALAESNITDLNITNSIGFDPRIQLGCVKGGDYSFGISGKSFQPVVGISLSLVPRIDRESDVLNDALKIGCQWYGGQTNSGRIYISANLFSLGRLF